MKKNNLTTFMMSQINKIRTKILKVIQIRVLVDIYK